jgi:hypothetical protein
MDWLQRILTQKTEINQNQEDDEDDPENVGFIKVSI